MTPLPPECEAALRQLDALRRGELSALETASLHQHLAACRRCLRVKEFEDAFLERLRAAGLTEQCPETLREKIRAQCADGTRDC